ncbi:MAG: TerB family tellurite resistance protein [Spirochaetaceae bacterium]
MSENINLTQSEAAVGLAALVSFADDDPSEAEGVVLRKYYRHATAESFQEKLSAAGVAYPSDLRGLEGPIVAALKAAPPEFRLRTVAVSLALALADGEADQEEMKLLRRVAAALEVEMADAQAALASGIPEIDESSSDEGAASVAVETNPVPDSLELTLSEAGIALSAWVGFSDDDPSDEETALIREHFGVEKVAAFLSKLEEAGLDYPMALSYLEGAIRWTLSRAARSEQLRSLSIAYAVAIADGEVEPEELSIIRRYCEEFGIGLGELREFFKTSIA